jgi:hypothetical protein
LLDSVTAHIARDHRRAVRAANTELLLTWWSIGLEILDRQRQEGGSAEVIDRSQVSLSGRAWLLAAEPQVHAGSRRRLVRRPWRHHQNLLVKLNDQPTPEWYAPAIENGWNRDILARHIEFRYHERAGKAIRRRTT